MRSSGSGPAAGGAAVAYDPDAQRVVLFGGCTGGGTTNQTWEWEPVTAVWTRRFPTTSPAPTCDIQMTWDDALRSVVYVDDKVWAWDSGTGSWTDLGAANHHRPTYAYDPSRQAILSFGGYGTPYYVTDDKSFELRGGVWTSLSTGVHPNAAAFFAAMAPVPARAEMLLVGHFGDIGGGGQNETWSWSFSGERPAHVVQFDSAPLEGAAVDAVTLTTVAGGAGVAVGGGQLYGVAIEVFSGGQWRVVDETTAPTGTPLSATSAIADPSVLVAATAGEQLSFRLSPRGTNGASTASVATDYVELEVSAHWP